MAMVSVLRGLVCIPYLVGSRLILSERVRVTEVGSGCRSGLSATDAGAARSSWEMKQGAGSGRSDARSGPMEESAGTGVPLSEVVKMKVSLSLAGSDSVAWVRSSVSHVSWQGAGEALSNVVKVAEPLTESSSVSGAGVWGLSFSAGKAGNGSLSSSTGEEGSPEGEVVRLFSGVSDRLADGVQRGERPLSGF